MHRARVVSFARAFATAKDKPFLSDAIAKAAIGKDAEVATSFVSAFAQVVHRKRVRVADVSPLDRLSITIVHLPMVPSVLNDMHAWNKVVTLPEHQVALESAELREWLHYLAHTSMKDGKVEMPPELRASPIFRKSAEMAEELVRTSAFSYSEKEMADFALQAEREKEEERAAAAAVLEKERAEREKERAAAAAALEKERAEREKERAEAAALRAELERLKRSG